MKNPPKGTWLIWRDGAGNEWPAWVLTSTEDALSLLVIGAGAAQGNIVVNAAVTARDDAGTRASRWRVR